jgi:hypothetical protein
VNLTARIENARSSAPSPIRELVGGVLLLMAMRGAADDALGVAQWSGAVWRATGQDAVWGLLAIVGFALLTVDLWLPAAVAKVAAATSKDAATDNVGVSPEKQATGPPIPNQGTGPDQESDCGSGLRNRLLTERKNGRLILRAIKDPFSAGLWAFDNRPSRKDVEPWRIAVDHLLRDRDDLRNIFNYEPPRMIGDEMSTVLADSFGGRQIRVLERGLRQLDRVLERV